MKLKSIPATFLHRNASAFIHSVFCAGLPFPDCKKQSTACNTHFSISIAGLQHPFFNKHCRLAASGFFSIIADLYQTLHHKVIVRIAAVPIPDTVRLRSPDLKPEALVQSDGRCVCAHHFKFCLLISALLRHRKHRL